MRDVKVPMDHCVHGSYVGDWAGPDYMCGLCESGQNVRYEATTYQLWAKFTNDRGQVENAPMSNMMYSPLKLVEMIVRYGNSGLFEKMPDATWWVESATFSDWWAGPCGVVFCEEPANWAGRFCDRHYKMVEFR